MGKLTTLSVKSAVQPGRYADGDGLSLVVKPDRRAWVLRVQHEGRSREFGLGSADAVTLAQARDKAATIRKQVRDGADPTADKQAAKAKRDAAAGRTFEAACRAAHKARLPRIKSEKTAKQWLTILEDHLFPALGTMAVADVKGGHVMEALAPIWHAKPETARKAMLRAGVALRWAARMGWRGDAPRLSEYAADTLGERVKPVRHHAAVPYADAPAVIARLRAAPETVGRLALLTTIYTAARSGETRGMTWGEVDLDRATWTVPAVRMKGGREHIVPLSAPALAIFDTMAKARRTNDLGELIFPGVKSGKPLSDMTLLKAQRAAAPATTPHGWRSAFRDWAGSETQFASDVLEECLAHTVGSKTERAYRRKPMLDKRRDVMDAWAAYLAPVAADNVVTLATRRRA